MAYAGGEAAGAYTCPTYSDWPEPRGERWSHALARDGDSLRAGESMDGVEIDSATRVSYTHDATYDILPDSDTGTYFAGGVLIGSTLSHGAALVARSTAPPTRPSGQGTPSGVRHADGRQPTLLLPPRVRFTSSGLASASWPQRLAWPFLRAGRPLCGSLFPNDCPIYRRARRIDLPRTDLAGA